MSKKKKSVVGWAERESLQKFGKCFENDGGEEYAFHGIYATKSAALWSHRKKDITKVRITKEEL